MKKIVPFKKELIFKTNLSEITSISLEHNLHLTDNNLVTGSFSITGDYKLTDSSVNTENFSFDLPFDINIDDKYDASNIVVDIDDFYYEIIDNKILSVNIEVSIDKLEEKPLIVKEEDTKEIENPDRCYDDEEDEMPFKEVKKEITQLELDDEKGNENIKSLFDNFSDASETYSTYKVYILRENDNIDTICQKYGISKEQLSLYNDINELKEGDKIIIPSLTNEKV